MLTLTTQTCSLFPLISSLTQLSHIHFPTSNLLCPIALTWSLSPLWQSGFVGSKLVAADPALQVGVKLVSWVAMELALLVGVKLALLGGSWQWWNAHSHLSDNLALLEASWKRWIWHCWDHAGSSGMLTFTSLIIWLRWEQAVNGESDFTGRNRSGFAGCSGSVCTGSKLAAVECSPSPVWQSGFAWSKLAAVDRASLGACW